MSDAVQIATLITGVVSTLGLAAIAYFTAKLNTRQQDAAIEVKEVKDTLATTDAKTTGKLDAIAVVADKTHTLVNNNMGVQLKLHAVTARRLADTTKDPRDTEAADLAEHLYNEHQGKQATVDAEHGVDKA